MTEQIDYYFTIVSPWAYIGHAPFMAIVKRHGLRARAKPVPIGQVFSETGGLPLGKRAPARQRYRILELQRWREKRGLNFKLRPKNWPFDGSLADRFVVAAVDAGHDPDAFLRRAFAAIWEGETSLADESTLRKIGSEAGLPSDALLAAAKSDATAATYEQNYRDAVATDAFGSPVYVRDGEAFWGQDRLDLFEDAVKSGRPGFRSDAM
ncbi:MAG: 2-hydroxychromene-2-carboxylate isomerase [Rhizobiales bacterium]|nr:2-hydroxychromene-2-carboxylate isomerase [Hyphomicrobiales bacterium]